MFKGEVHKVPNIFLHSFSLFYFFPLEISISLYFVLPISFQTYLVSGNL